MIPIVYQFLFDKYIYCLNTKVVIKENDSKDIVITNSGRFHKTTEHAKKSAI